MSPAGEEPKGRGGAARSGRALLWAAAALAAVLAVGGALARFRTGVAWTEVLLGSGAALTAVVGGLLLFARLGSERKRAAAATAASEERLRTLLDNTVTERRRSEEALRTAKEFSESLVGSSPVAMFVLDADHRVLFWNHACEALTGVSAAELLETTAHWKAFYPAPRPCLADLVLDGLQGEAAVHYPVSGPSILAPSGLRAEGWYPRLGGKDRYIVFDAAPLCDGEGRLIGAVETLQDFSERRRAEEELARLAAAVDQTAEGITVADLSGTIRYVNHAFEEITGYARADVCGTPHPLLEGAVGDEGFSGPARGALERGEVWKGHRVNRRRDGNEYDEETTVSPVRDAGGRVVSYVAVNRDVTLETELQRRLSQAQKMEALGTLAGGIAHDFNNILAAIIGFTELTRDDLPEGSRERGNLDRVVTAGARARDLIRQILSFSRPSSEEREAVQVAPVIDETFTLLRTSLPATVVVRTAIRAPLVSVVIEPTRLQQVLLNLCANAGHAMKDTGGTLTVGLDEMQGDFREPAPDAAPTRWAEISVSDTGPGIPAEIRDRIFEPFFTTKDVGEGSGLGLSVAHAIVTSHGGTIAVETAPDCGATFRVRLPAAADPSNWGAEFSEKPAGGRILFLDDEEVVVALGVRALTLLGYEVVSAPDGAAALERFRRDPAAFDLVVADQRMPGLSGSDLARELHFVRPDLPVLLCTGFDDIDFPDGADSLGVREVLRKPFAMGELAAAVRRALGPRPSHGLGQQKVSLTTYPAREE